ncbi:nucleoside deaminase [Mobilicoccus massiliensis]|uniref:nucleoside deaminase n=1 Tax=Mobilicoccus massiliensis TaxID=1522310 RepID=UPI0009E5825B|nr:nucleoside deaminase [Mobilicoccus massiliensis]
MRARGGGGGRRAGGGTREFEPWLEESLALAAECLPHGDVPVGAVVVDANGHVIGRGRNVREQSGDPTGHAEILALRAAAASRGGWRLDGCTLVVTLEPCAMCAGALVQARVDRVVFGAWDDKAGACGSVWDLVRDPRALHRVEVVGGVQEARCAHLLLDFFGDRR